MSQDYNIAFAGNTSWFLYRSNTRDSGRDSHLQCVLYCRKYQRRYFRDSDHSAPGIVGISCNQDTVGILDSDDVTLQILMEIICCVVVDDAADRVLVVVERNQGTVTPGFLQDLGTVELVGVQYAVNFLACTDAVELFLYTIDCNLCQYLTQITPPEPDTGSGRRGKQKMSKE